MKAELIDYLIENDKNGNRIRHVIKNDIGFLKLRYSSDEFVRKTLNYLEKWDEMNRTPNGEIRNEKADEIIKKTIKKYTEKYRVLERV